MSDAFLARVTIGVANAVKPLLGASWISLRSGRHIPRAGVSAGSGWRDA